MNCRIMKRFSFFSDTDFFNHLSVFVICFSTNKVLLFKILLLLLLLLLF